MQMFFVLIADFNVKFYEFFFLYYIYFFFTIFFIHQPMIKNEFLINFLLYEIVKKIT